MIAPILTAHDSDFIYLIKWFNFIRPEAWEFIQSKIDKMSPHQRTEFRAEVYKKVNSLWGTILIDFGVPLGDPDGYQIHHPMPEFSITYKGEEVCRI